MKNFFFWDRYLNELEKDIFPQPQRGDMHFFRAKDIIEKWVSKLDVKDVLDVGCGEGFCQEFFDAYGIEYSGITLSSEDLVEGRKRGRHIWAEDFNFLSCVGDKYDLIFARHALEHSPAPILTLMEWHRVARKYLVLVNPSPKHGICARNHYSVVPKEQLVFWCARAGWAVIREQENDKEIWILAEKVERRIPYYEN